MRYSEILKRNQEAGGPRRKGERTRDRLLLAAAKALDKSGYLDLKISDICKGAGVALPTFYVYFQSKNEITMEVLSDFLDKLLRVQMEVPRSDSAFETIYRTNLSFLKGARANSGLFRCLLQLTDESPEFARLNHRVRMEWYRRVSGGVVRNIPGAADVQDQITIAAYALGGMADEIIRRLLVHADRGLDELTRRNLPSDEDLAEFLSLLCYRGFYGSNPDNLHNAAVGKFAELTLATPDGGEHRKSAARKRRKVEA